MADIYKLIHPNKYYDHYVSLDTRPDGRDFQSFRPIIVNVGSFKTADASSLVKFGNTSAVCGIKLELATPRAEEPDVGFLVMNIELSALCSPKYRPGPPSDNAQVLSTMLNEIITSSKCMDLKQLCVVRDKVTWVLHCDVYCLDYDGSVIDACITALLAALKTVRLPHVEYDGETEAITVDPTKTLPLHLSCLPIPTTFCTYKHNDQERVVTDPNAFEEELAGGCGAGVTVCWKIYGDEGAPLALHKLGGYTLPLHNQKSLFQIAHKRAKLVEQAIEIAINNKPF